MPIEPHPSFKHPEDQDVRIWRFMDLEKFISMLHTKTLFFSNVEQLAISDPYEGLLPEGNYSHRFWTSKSDVLPNDPNVSRIKALSDEEALTLMEQLKEERELRIAQSFAYRRSFFVSCWRLAEFESALMWNAYAASGYGIAITSSPRRIATALKSVDQSIYMGLVQYTDYSKFFIDLGNVHNYIMSKRSSFEDERELRIAFWDTSITHEISTELMPDFNAMKKDDRSQKLIMGKVTRGRDLNEVEALEVPPGIHFDCNLDELIEEVHASPTAPDWVCDAVKAVADKFDLHADVMTSDLMQSPPR